jgi:NAD(P)-dependent dehydrogenase (short-subunit alcohol dehydrogenase family)
VTSSILVTGGTGAVGSMVTQRLLSDGHRVATTWLNDKEPAELSLEAEDSGLLLVRTDVTDPISIANALEEIQSRHGAVDTLVHLVGAWSGGTPVHEHSLENWNKMLAINLTSAFLCCRAVLPRMLERNRGRIVLTSSRSTEADRSGQVAYAASKAGVEALAQTITEENKGADVTVNVIAPSTVDTPANRRAMPQADFSKWVLPQEIAATVSFLVGDRSGALRGSRFSLYGGV